MEALQWPEGSCNSPGSGLPPADAPELRAPEIAALLMVRPEYASEDDAAELLEMRYQEHRARKNLETVFGNELPR